MRTTLELCVRLFSLMYLSSVIYYKIICLFLFAFAYKLCLIVMYIPLPNKINQSIDCAFIQLVLVFWFVLTVFFYSVNIIC